MLEKWQVFKLTFLSVLLFSFVNLSFGQKQTTARFDYDLAWMTSLGNLEIYSGSLHTGKDFSVFDFKLKSTIKDTLSKSEISVNDKKASIDIKLRKNYNDSGFYWNDFEKKFFLVKKKHPDKSFDVLVETKKEKVNYQFKNERQKIGSLNCKLVIATMNNIKYEIWYSSDIKISSGPLFFHDLPGAVVKLKSYDNSLIINLTEVASPYVNDLEIPRKIPRLTNEEYSLLAAEAGQKYIKEITNKLNRIKSKSQRSEN